MKTPREILLARHKTAPPKLDALRQAVVGKLSDETPRKQRSPISLASWCLGGFQNIWRELIFPCRFIWTGLAAVWLLILAANVSMQDHGQPAMAKSSPSPQVIVAYRQQQQLLTELIGPNDPPVAEPQKPYVPRPSSLRSLQIMTA